MWFTSWTMHSRAHTAASPLRKVTTGRLEPAQEHIVGGQVGTSMLRGAICRGPRLLQLAKMLVADRDVVQREREDISALSRLSMSVMG